jgi:toxin ParE1/3/4
MPAANISFHRLAAREYRLARKWYRERSAEVAERFVLAVNQAVSRMEADADSLSMLVGAYRYIKVARYPYLLIFRRIDGAHVVVVAVAHTSRRPRYWRRRM